MNELITDISMQVAKASIYADRLYLQSHVATDFEYSALKEVLALSKDIGDLEKKLNQIHTQLGIRARMCGICKPEGEQQ